MNVLVTGAAGFVGGHLTRHLSKHGHEVIATGRSPTPPDGLPAGASWRGELDVTRDSGWAEALERADAVVHLAARAHRMEASARADEDAYKAVNVEGTRRLAELSAEAPAVGRFVMISSIGALGSNADAPLAEDAPPHPDTPYGRSKLHAEEALAATLRNAEVEPVVLRPPLVYGPDNPGNMDRLLRLVRLQLPIPLGAISNRRSFIFVGNLVDAIRTALDHPAAPDQVFHVADQPALSTPELIRAIAAAAGTRVRLPAVPVAGLKVLARLGDAAGTVLGRSVPIDSYSVDRLCGSLAVDDRRIRSVLGWSPPWPIHEALRVTLTGQGSLS